MKYKCTNQRCGITTTEPDEVDGKYYCAVCHYEVEEVKKKKPWRPDSQSTTGITLMDHDPEKARLERFVLAALTGLLAEGKSYWSAVPGRAISVAKNTIEELNKDA